MLQEVEESCRDI